MNQAHLRSISVRPGPSIRMKVMLDVRDGTGTGSFSFEEFPLDPQLLSPRMNHMTDEDRALFDSICAEPFTADTEAMCRQLCIPTKGGTSGDGALVSAGMQAPAGGASALCHTWPTNASLFHSLPLLVIY